MEYIEVSAKTIDDALTEASIKLGTTSDKLEYEVIDKGSNGFLGIGSRDAVIKVKKAEASVEDEIREFLDSVFKAMKLEVTIDIKVDGTTEMLMLSLTVLRWAFNRQERSDSTIHSSTLQILLSISSLRITTE